MSKKPVALVVAVAVAGSGFAALADQPAVPPDPNNLHQPREPIDLPDWIGATGGSSVSVVSDVSSLLFRVNGMTGEEVNVTPIRDFRKAYNIRPPFKA